ncbi:hypothetical protein [Absidia glauca]|uniref:Ndc10 domain-containing protein n=1 Tax=Absidia glauca TaxID=4829 RepID=A0A163IQ99_ABSGL|nr:hypothetical protein [Absidia glauca]
MRAGFENPDREKSAFDHLPEMIRSVAGFPAHGRSFYLARAAHLPASARSCSRRSTKDMTDWWQKKLSADNNNPIQPAFAANVFVQVIMMLRKAFIQGSVLMMELHPCHPIRQHSIFSDPAYLSFKRDLLQIEAQEQYLALLLQCVPMQS